MNISIENKKYVTNWLLQYFKRENTKIAFDLIHSESLTGWEKWWQFDVAMYGARSRAVRSIYTERRFRENASVRKVHGSVAFDLAVKFKKCMPNNYFFLELKQDENIECCLLSMRSDMAKFEKLASGSKSDIHDVNFGRILYVGLVPSWEGRDEVAELAEDIFDCLPDNEKVLIHKVAEHFFLLSV